MPHQIGFAQAEYDAKRKTTRRERFLAEMEPIVPWDRLLDELRPVSYAQTDRGRGRPPIGLERMLRMHFLQQWFGLADEALEDAMYDSQAFRGFLGGERQHRIVEDWQTRIAAAGGWLKPAVQSLYIDLDKHPQAFLAEDTLPRRREALSAGQSQIDSNGKA
ncbi:hypothetical protein ThimaDRAFT_0647 [Thiocapsa marina 5811]|uniref:Transposase InsH N-terminal domain-containing protein n=1 Tax=Thiocapsa marina 5811 TaxID=768671 RepID=F9U6U5_9GAMM|nr:hypothetical protein ThimaDRAFT_0647 [Thiocapsa marina 5811]